MHAKKRKREMHSDSASKKRASPTSAVLRQQEIQFQLYLTDQTREKSVELVAQRGERGKVDSQRKSIEPDASGDNHNNSLYIFSDAVQRMAVSLGEGALNVDQTNALGGLDPLLDEPGFYSDNLANMFGQPQLYGNGWDTFFTNQFADLDNM